MNEDKQLLAWTLETTGAKEQLQQEWSETSSKQKLARLHKKN